MTERLWSFVDYVEVDEGVKASTEEFWVETKPDREGVFVDRCELSFFWFNLDRLLRLFLDLNFDKLFTIVLSLHH